MHVDIKTKNFDLTDAIRSFTEEKMNLLEPKLQRFGESVSIEVEVGKTTEHHNKGPVFRAEVHVRLPGKLVYADANNYDLYIAINDARKEAERQIIDYKETLTDKTMSGAREAKERLSDIRHARGENASPDGPEVDAEV